MKTPKTLYALIICLVTTLGFSQTAHIKGIILNTKNKPIVGANIKTKYGGTKTNSNGFYLLKIPINRDITVTFSHLSYQTITATFHLKNNISYEFNPVMSTSVKQIATAVITSKNKKDIYGIQTLSPEIIREIPSANPGVENLLLTLPGVNNNNELSTQYAVRGGNFDENLVYVNGIEVYRPFLIRSGQQEGLSFVNTDLVQNVDFSSGGFQAKYGDKLSSVLDITYKTPHQFEMNADISLLGGALAVEGLSKDSKLTGILGMRYRDNGLLVKSKEINTHYKAAFSDIQTFLTYRFSPKFQVHFLGNFTSNNYRYKPQDRQTNFGTLTNPTTLVVFYDGQEKDQYKTLFGALKASFFVNNHLNLHLTSSIYNTIETEHFDILAQYRLETINGRIGDVDFGAVEFNKGIGNELKHGRNDLDALIYAIAHQGTFKRNNSQLAWGINYKRESIWNRLVEWESLNLAGNAVRPPGTSSENEEPYIPFRAPIEPYQHIRGTNRVTIHRIQGYAQWSKRIALSRANLWFNLGARAHHWSVSNTGSKNASQVVFSPRGQLAIKPHWKQDMLFRVSTGLYYQPPFYGELRDVTGQIHPDIQAQKAVHFVLGNDYSFKLWKRPFKLTTEAYYKRLRQVNPYTLENVRIRYRAQNNAKAYAYGLDIRLNGEFVPNTESWISLGYLKTEESIDNRGYIARPTDQRLKFAMLFQDYIPKLPHIKMYLNLAYNTGLPGGSPSYADPYVYQTRLPDYRRADIGFQFVLVDAKKQFKSGWKKAFKALSLGVEIFNVFDIQNSITNTWVRSASSKQQFAIPNYLTPRVFNLRAKMRF